LRLPSEDYAFTIKRTNTFSCCAFSTGALSFLLFPVLPEFIRNGTAVNLAFFKGSAASQLALHFGWFAFRLFAELLLLKLC
jgi:hypothetical protein